MTRSEEQRAREDRQKIIDLLRDILRELKGERNEHA